MLTLWKVSIPVLPKKDRKQISLVDFPSNSKEELDETDDMSFLAPVPAQPSTPRAKDLSRSSTPIPSIFIPQGNIEAESADIFKGAGHKQTSKVLDAKDVEKSQRGILGRFYKRPLPYHEKAVNISLVMLGLELDKQAKTSESETLREIVDKDLGRSSDHRVVAMVAPTGSGKTATVIDLASKYFLIYAVCCIPSPAASPGFKDPNFIVLADDIESMYRAVIHKNQSGWQDAVDTDSEVKALAGERVKIEFLARLLFLQNLLCNNPDLEPRQFFHEQTSERGASTIRELVNSVRD
ncbi:hypothetical protein BGX27_011481 [Mortierella sp. AM989]|nr:hypothetical protein BGX27_011481 [Mortierella sp. AM989]